ncbi:hypothetical protein [Mucilaginibacter aquaedulcis]|uniref:hypothetical protein n=1 Tax=Mucilaginibacter aquaedulcis TaxID=1187081 RepID=UPI0025B4FCC0|nr:hypothetical protein [Mucilaginibacter aquaedulcis]MDN3548807.1 hypothetical protein [Mucilaginibacter aquaedulcis]
MKSIPYFLFSIVVCVVFGCKGPSVSYNESLVVNKTNLQYTKLKLDSLMLDSVNSSYVGDIALFNDNIFFIDKKFSYLYKFSSTGKFLNRYLGQGNGKDELPIKTVAYFSFLPNGRSIVIGPGWDCYIFDNNFKRVDGYQANWHLDVPKDVMLKEPDPERSQMYSFIYDGNIKASNDKILFPILSQHPKFNPTRKEYASKALALGEMSLDNGSVRTFGKFCPSYNHDFNSMVFCYSYPDWYENNNMVLTFAADPKLYIADEKFNIIETFGQAGRGMDTKYTNTTKLQDFKKNWFHQDAAKGHYTFLKYLKDQHLLFRGYHKSINEKTDGLQIYKNDVLIGDVDVPLGFKVAGYIKPYYYSSPYINEDKGEIKIYKMTL